MILSHQIINMSQYIIIIHTHVIYAKYYNFVLRYGSKNVLLMVVNYMWKTDHLSYIIVRKNSKI